MHHQSGLSSHNTSSPTTPKHSDAKCNCQYSFIFPVWLIDRQWRVFVVEYVVFNMKIEFIISIHS